MTNEEIIVLLGILVGFLLIGFFFFEHAFFRENKERWRLHKENQKLRRLLEQRIQMDSDCLNAYCAMLREASRSGHGYPD